MRPDEAALARRLIAQFCDAGESEGRWQAVARFVLEREEELRADFEQTCEANAKLRVEIGEIKLVLESQDYKLAAADAENLKLLDDIEEARRLLGVAEEADAGGVTMYVRVSDENARLRAENERLLGSIRDTDKIAQRLRNEHARDYEEIKRLRAALAEIKTLVDGGMGLADVRESLRLDDVAYVCDDHEKLRASVETLKRSQRHYERENSRLRAMLLAALSEGVSREWDAKVRTLLEGENE